MFFINSRCVITYTESTEREDFYGQGADAKIPSLKGVTLDDLFSPLKAGQSDLLPTKRDAKTGASTSVPKVAPVEAASTGPVTGTYKGWTPHQMIVANNKYTSSLNID